MKKIFLPFLLLTFLTACEKEQAIAPEAALEARTNDVWLCHKPEGQNPVSLWVDASSMESHLAHGDVLLDADGDGFTAINTCGEGSQDDCDDNNAQINPGAEEVYGDGIDNDCDGQIDEGELEVTVNTGSEIYTLYVYPFDNSMGTQWGEYGVLTNATNNWNGAENTGTIEAMFPGGSYAANICANLVTHTGSDWYLPAKEELNAMYQQLGPGGSGDMTDGDYWSSTEGGYYGARGQLFGNGGAQSNYTKYNYFRCRCVRR